MSLNISIIQTVILKALLHIILKKKSGNKLCYCKIKSWHFYSIVNKIYLVMDKTFGMVKATHGRNHKLGKILQNTLVLYIFFYKRRIHVLKYIVRETQQLHVTNLILFQDLINRVDQNLEFGMVTTSKSSPVTEFIKLTTYTNFQEFSGMLQRANLTLLLFMTLGIYTFMVYM